MSLPQPSNPSSPCLSCASEQRHVKPRYPLHKVAELLEVDEVTFRLWLREGGIPLEDGRRIRINYVPLGVRNKVFLKEEVERVFRELEAAGVELASANSLDLLDEDERAEHRPERAIGLRPNELRHASSSNACRSDRAHRDHGASRGRSGVKR